MKNINIIITGANGFVGKNLKESLKRINDINLYCYDIGSSLEELNEQLKKVDIIYHLAGTNRTNNIDEYDINNFQFTKYLCDKLEEYKNKAIIVFSSTIQSTLDNPYGMSKKKAEEYLIEYSRKNNVFVNIYRFKNIFGKWGIPNYNSVVTTFCYNISRGISINISDPNTQIDFIYIDDVIDSLLENLNCENKNKEYIYTKIERSNVISLGELAQKINSFEDARKTSIMLDFQDYFTKCLFSTYMSYVDVKNLVHIPIKHIDDRGILSEIIKSKNVGQFFISRTHPNITRGNHYHNSKIEKFIVIEGECVIRLYNLLTKEIVKFNISGNDFNIIDIPPGYSHSIQNVGKGELVVLFWANEIFDSKKSDTFFLEIPND